MDEIDWDIYLGMLDRMGLTIVFSVANHQVREIPIELTEDDQAFAHYMGLVGNEDGW